MDISDESMIIIKNKKLDYVNKAFLVKYRELI